jgi:hypothetical protein
MTVGQSQEFSFTQSGGTPTLSFTWLVNNLLAPGDPYESTYIFTPTSTGTYVISVMITDGLGLQANPTAQAFVSEPTSGANLQVVALSPVNLLVTDKYGQREGADASGNVYNEIAGATYSGPGSEPQIITLPGSNIGEYSLQMFATGTGPFTITVINTAQDGSTEGTTTWKGTVSQGETWGAEFTVYNDGSVGSGNLFVVPEYLLGSLLALTACFVALIIYKKRPNIRHPDAPT